jgi:hypothetical protein
VHVSRDDCAPQPPISTLAHARSRPRHVVDIVDDERWAAAESVLDGSSTEWARRRMRRQRRLFFSITIGFRPAPRRPGPP